MTIRYSIGLDLGDAESAVAVCELASDRPARVLDDRALPSAIGREFGPNRTVRTLIGIDALTNEEADRIRINFKVSPNADNPDWERDYGRELLAFAEALVARVRELVPWTREDARLTIGCPVAWVDQEGVVARYRALFATSASLPTDIDVIPESRSALVQFWFSDDLPEGALDQQAVLVIDLGSSTTDLTAIVGGHPDEEPASAELGLFEIDEALYATLRAAHPDLDRRAAKRPSQKQITLYLCRLRKEAEYGGAAAPDPDLMDGRPWAADYWETLREADVPAAFGSTGDPDSWLGRLDAILAAAARRFDGAEPLVIVTGGGAQVPLITSAVRARFDNAEVRIARDPALAVAIGLAEYGRLEINAARYEKEVRAAIAGQAVRDRIHRLYPPLYRDLLVWHQRHVVEGIWKPMADLWKRDELKLSTRGEFQGFALSLFRQWIDRNDPADLRRILDRFSADIGDILRETTRAVLDRLPLAVRELTFTIRLSPVDLFQPYTLSGYLANRLIWAQQSAMFRTIDLAPMVVRRTLGGKFLDAALALEEKGREMSAEMTEQWLRARKVSEEVEAGLDRYVAEAVEAALTETLADIRLLLLRATPRGTT